MGIVGIIGKTKHWISDQYNKVHLTPQNKNDISNLFQIAISLSCEFFSKNLNESICEQMNSDINCFKKYEDPMRVISISVCALSVLWFSLQPRIMNNLLSQIVSSNNTDLNQKKGIALYLEAKDPALQKQALSNFCDNPGKFYELSQIKELSKDFEVQISNIGEINDIGAVIDKAANSKLPIKIVIIHAHGKSYEMHLDKDQDFYGFEAELKDKFKKLDPKCIFILRSCFTGRLSNIYTCFAKRLAENSERTVFAPTDKNSQTAFGFSAEKCMSMILERTEKDAELPISVRFRKYNPSTGKFEDDITAVFKNDLQAIVP